MTIKRAAKQNDHCIDLVVKFPAKQGEMSSSVPKLTADLKDGVGLSFGLFTSKSIENPDKFRTAYFCLSEKILKSSKFIFYYFILRENATFSSCSEEYEINNLDELLAQSE